MDTDKGTRYRSRLCAMGFKQRGVASLFAGTPPYESLRLLMAILSQGRRRGQKALCLGVTDIKRAHFHAPRSAGFSSSCPLRRRYLGNALA